jgi:CRP-like cAMP-binding protein
VHDAYLVRIVGRRLMNNKQLQLALLRNFSPLDGLKSENLHSLARKAALADLPRGSLLFRQGEADKRTYYLVSGTVELLRHGRASLVMQGGSPEARNPIAPTNPRHCSCRVISRRAEYVAMDSDVLDMVLMWDQTGRYEVDEVLGIQDQKPSGDWMLALLQTRALHRIPPANLQAMFLRMERLELAAGQQVIKQGDAGDYFYVIVKGRCKVTREAEEGNRGSVHLAELGVGDTFGEEALVCEAARNANVSMMTDGVLMRLGKDDFRSLLNEPLLAAVDFAEAKRIVAQGGEWLDVRMRSEFERYRLREATNVPLFSIREKMKTLDRDKHYVVCCDTGRRSSAAAYILAERGFDASVLKGGLPPPQLPERTKNITQSSQSTQR